MAFKARSSPANIGDRSTVRLPAAVFESNLESEIALQREIARLEELRVETIERRIDADLETGRNSDLVGEPEMETG